MDPALIPPMRIKPLSARPLGIKPAQASLDGFLADMEARGSAGKDTAVTVQLQKLNDALREERKKN